MRLGLRMGLNSRQGGGGDLPSLDFAFALDRSFTTDPAAPGGALITSRRGPAAKFTRGTGATQVNAAGLIEYAPENLILPSGSATNSASTYFTRVVTGELDPDGDTTAEFTSLATVSQARLQYTGILGSSYFSVWVKSKEGSPLPAFIHLVVGDGPRSRFDTSNWAILNELGAIGSVEYGANGWVKLRSLFPATTASALFKIVVTDGPTYGDGIAAGKVFILGGKQVSRNPSSQHYKTTSSAFYGPQLDYDPETLVSEGLLIEEPRENFALHSRSIANLYWASFATASATDNITTSPSGVASSASRITANSGTDPSRYRLALFSLSAGSSQRTASVFLKAGTHGFGVLVLAFNKVGIGVVRSSEVRVNLSNGSSVQTGTLTGFSFSVTPYLNGWYRVAISATSNASTAVEDQAVMAFGMSYDGAGGSGFFAGTETVFADGPQLEAGASPTSYIPTTTGTAARSADVCSITDADFSSFYNQSEGTWVVDFILESNTSALQYLVDKNSFAVPIVYKSNGTIKAGLNQVFEISNPTPLALNTLYRVAFAYKAGDYGLSVNGSAVTTSNNAGNPALPTEIIFGSRGNLAINSPIARITYYRKRLPNAKLQTLTAP